MNRAATDGKLQPQNDGVCVCGSVCIVQIFGITHICFLFRPTALCLRAPRTPSRSRSLSIYRSFLILSPSTSSLSLLLLFLLLYSLMFDGLINIYSHSMGSTSLPISAALSRSLSLYLSLSLSLFAVCAYFSLLHWRVHLQCNYYFKRTAGCTENASEAAGKWRGRGKVINDRKYLIGRSHVHFVHKGQPD